MIQNYDIITDTGANLPDDLIEKFKIKIVSLSFFINSVEYLSYEEGKKTDLAQFYDMMKDKIEIKTSLVSPERFQAAFEETLSCGKDLLYIGISSGITGTVNSARIAADILKDKYPERKIIVIDSLSAAMGLGLLVYKAGEMRLDGKSIDEVAAMVEKNKLRVAHWFSVEDLFFLQRGGRVSTTTAMFGSILNIKPVLHVDDNGKLISMSKVKGRKQSLLALAEKFKELSVEGENDVIAFSHGNCLEDVQFIADELKKTYKFKEIIFNCLDPVIGAHSGPGTVSIFFIAKNR